jgi:hypothetical protein
MVTTVNLRSSTPRAALGRMGLAGIPLLEFIRLFS